MNNKFERKKDFVLMELGNYVRKMCFRKGETLTACSKRLNVSPPIIYKLVNNIQGVSLNQMVKVLRNDGKLNEESVGYIFGLFLAEFAPDPVLSLQVTKCKEQKISGLRYTSMGHLLGAVHKLSDEQQIDVMAGTGISCSFIQKAIKGEGSQSCENLNVLFWYYMQIIQPGLRAEYVYNFLNLLCARMFMGDDCFYVTVEG